MNIYVGNLPYTLKEDDLQELFAEYGNVTSVNIISDKFSGQSKGFAFVEMENQADAEEAIKQINGRQVSGRNLKVNQARPRNDRPKQRRW